MKRKHYGCTAQQRPFLRFPLAEGEIIRNDPNETIKSANKHSIQ